MSTQIERIVAFIEANQGCSILDIARGMDPFIANPRARISDARAIPGIDIDCRRRADGELGYWLTRDESGPGVARITADDSARQVERKMAAAFAPVAAMREAWDRVFGGDA